jgi:hypothetical protein
MALTLTRNRIACALLTTALCVGMAAPAALAQTAGQDMKDAGHETKNATKDVGHGVAKGTKKAYHKTEHGTEKAYDKTKEGTEKGYHKTAQGTKKVVHGTARATEHGANKVEDKTTPNQQ